MSEVLARIRVRETHGIRRFLYPLTAAISIPLLLKMSENKSLSDLYGGFVLRDAQGLDVPRQINGLSGSRIPDVRLDFALSLAPHETQNLIVVQDASLNSLADPLHVSSSLEGGLKNAQERFRIGINPEGTISEVVYDGTRHLRGPSSIMANDKAAWYSSSTCWYGDYYTLCSQLHSKSRYDNGGFAQTRVELTACKSWSTVTHALEQPRPNDEIVFTLPLATTSPTLTCDFGVGGYVFGKMDSKATEIVWRTEFGDAPYAEWTIATAGRVDYMGEVDSAEAFLPQRWFHLIDSDKALAVAITKLPDACQSMTVRLTIEGDVSIAFTLGETVTGSAEFGVCYHFLNDVPAIAAATNPQSILLPPIVEVLG